MLAERTGHRKKETVAEQAHEEFQVDGISAHLKSSSASAWVAHFSSLGDSMAADV